MAKTSQTASATEATEVAPGVSPNAARPLPGSRPRGRPRKTRSELDEGNRRRLIVEGAARLFRAKGYAAASTRDIAAAAGMRSGSPFYHFKSKGALLIEVMQHGMAQAAASQSATLAALSEVADPRERLAALVRNHLEALVGVDSDFIPVMLYEWRSLKAAQRGRIARATEAYADEWLPTLEALHAAGALRADPRTARLLIFGALNWAVRWFDPRGPLSLDALTEQSLRLFIHES